nr:MAG TPA: hypothetical protein [Caudoviricetes sp.]
MPCPRILRPPLAEVRGAPIYMTALHPPMPGIPTRLLHSPSQTGTRPVPLLVPPPAQGAPERVRTERTDRIFRSVPTSQSGERGQKVVPGTKWYQKLVPDFRLQYQRKVYPGTTGTISTLISSKKLEN